MAFESGESWMFAWSRSGVFVHDAKGARAMSRTAGAESLGRHRTGWHLKAFRPHDPKCLSKLEPLQQEPRHRVAAFRIHGSNAVPPRWSGPARPKVLLRKYNAAFRKPV